MADRSIKWVFLDRDGTLNTAMPQGSYVERPEQLELLPGAAAGVAMLNRAGLRTCLVTNQRGVALGHMSAADLDVVHEHLVELLAREGARLDAIYACPHEEGECACRKPAPGLFLRAREEVPAIDFTRSAIVGDRATDIEVGRALGLRTVLIAGAGQDSPADADHCAPDLPAAAGFLLASGAQAAAASARG